MRIAIINQPTNNRGDESAHKALIRRLNADLSNANISVIFIGRTESHLASLRVEGEHNRYVNLRNWHKWYGLTELQRKGYFLLTLWHPTTIALMWQLLRADVVMCAPGGINMGGFQSWYHIYELRLAKLLRKPIVYWGRSIGPFPEQTAYNREFKKQSVRLLHYFSFISLRDKKSQDEARQIGVDYESTVDSAFLADFKHVISDDVKAEITNNYVVFVPNRLTWHYKYSSTSQSLIDDFWLSLLKQIRTAYPQSRIVMLPQTFGDGALSDGWNYFRQLAQQSGISGIYVAPPSCDSDEQQTIVSGAQCVIGARYHSIVFAINANVPFVSLSYEHKMSGLLQMVGATGAMVNIEEAFSSAEAMHNTLQQTQQVINASACNISSIRSQVMQISEHCYQRLLSYLKNLKK